MNSSKMKIVRNSLCYNSGLNFQNKIAIILQYYYKMKGYEYVNPNPAGGDDKNDGWVEKLGVFYQIFSPTNYSKSFVKEVLNKFKEDANKLFDNVYKKKLWKKPIKEFIFIVNTRDQSIPKDSNLECENVISNLNKAFSTNTSWKLVNFDYISDLLLEFEGPMERNLMVKLDLDEMLNYSNTNEKTLISFLDTLSCNVHNVYLNSSEESSYTRVSSEEKIKINELVPISERINEIICKLSVVENAVSMYNTTDPLQQTVVKAKNYIISKYNELHNDKKGVELYYAIIKSITELAPELNAFLVPAEMFVVYVFDKCDIFEKE